MVQFPSLAIGDTPVDLTDGLNDGYYRAQVDPLAEDEGVLWATAASAPADDADYFQASGGEYFTFEVLGSATVPTWAKTSLPGRTFALKLARTS